MSSWMVVAFGAVAVVVLAVAAFFLHETQERQRADLRERYADRTVVASELLESLFSIALMRQVDDLSEELRGAQVPTARLDARVRAGNARWAAVIDSSGRIVGASSGAPRAELQRLAGASWVRDALRPGGYGLGDLIDNAVPTATGFPAPSGWRALISGSSLETFEQFLSGTLEPLPGVRQARAYIFDGNGRRLAVATQDIRVLPRTPALSAALRDRMTGTFVSDTGRRFFASEPIAGSRWRLVVTVPERVLYANASGVGRALPWVILGLSALALLGVTVLLRRLIRTASALRRAIGSLESSNAELARSNADLEQFAYVASHDLSEPLRTVAGFSQLLGKRYRGKLDDDADVFIDHMSAGVDRMQQLIDDLLLYSRVGREPVIDAPVDLGEVLGEVLHAIEPSTRERSGQITSDELPTVLGERGQLRQVVQNLLVNAMKFTAEDVEPRIHVSAARDGHAWRISVADNGIGVAPDQREAIFKMFGRLHPADAYPGTGIGLALVKRIIERHGGHVWVEPGHDGGSVFCFTLPDRAPVVDRAAAPREGVTA